MPRINPTVSSKAEKIYNDMPQGERGKFVSDAIIEKHNKESGTIFTSEEENRIREIIREEVRKCTIKK